MTASLTSKLSIAIKSTAKNPLDLVTPEAVLDLVKSWSLADGTGNSQNRILWTDERSLAESANESLDLSGALTDALGQAAVFAKVAAIFFFADSANPGNVTLLGVANSVPFLGTPTTDAMLLQPGGAIAIIGGPAGYTVTNSTGDLVKWATAASAGTYKVRFVIVGR